MRLPLLASLSIAILATACGSPRSSSNPTDGGTTPTDGGSNAWNGTDAGMPNTDHGPYPGQFATPPQVVNLGGAVLKNPKFIPVFFSNDDAKTISALTDFLSKVGSTKYWLANVAEYGAGAGSSAPAVMLTETSTGTITADAIDTWMAGKLNSNDPAFPAPDENSVYVLHYPAGVTITDQSQMGTGQSCRDFGGYHSSTTLDSAHGGVNVAYAVIPRCSDFGGLTGVDAITGAESHELIEATTDPYPQTAPAYGQVDDDHLYWLFALGGGETGDMCAQDPAAFTQFGELPYTVQRTWSNNAVAAGHDPCVPALPGEVYFNATPEMSDPITINAGPGQQLTMTGVKIAVGESQTIPLDLYSDGPTSGAWRVTVKDANELFGGSADLQFTLDKDTGYNGDKLNLTIKKLKTSRYGVDLFFVISTLGQEQHMWIGLVGG